MRYAPRGVVAVISPWNFPLAIPTGMVSAALATGNAVILKPAEQSPGCALRVVEALHEAGVPGDALALLPGFGETGAALLRDPGVSTIAFTGSAAVGLEIIEAAAGAQTSEGQLKRVVAEMGGKNCVIVDADADLDQVVPEVIASAFVYGGQKCSACARVIAHEAIAGDLERRLAGAVATLVVDQAERFGTDVPPLIERDARDRVERYRQLAAEQGRLVASQDRVPDRGWFAAPAIVADLPEDSPLLREEIFGPLITIEPATSIDAACDAVEALPFALTAGLFSRDPETVAEVAARLPVGNLYVNRRITGAMVGRQPFGGNRLSGVGAKAGGPDYLLQFVESRVVSENTMRHGLVVE
jgi:RHH-type proline utilization regulon transcriptional repressor/proline dehydrogenase/delta 1-pyrroline-5-carboxylate dehydrogenase